MVGISIGKRTPPPRLLTRDGVAHRDPPVMFSRFFTCALTFLIRSLWRAHPSVPPNAIVTSVCFALLSRPPPPLLASQEVRVCVNREAEVAMCTHYVSEDSNSVRVRGSRGSTFSAGVRANENVTRRASPASNVLTNLSSNTQKFRQPELQFTQICK